MAILPDGDMVNAQYDDGMYDDNYSDFPDHDYSLASSVCDFDDTPPEKLCSDLKVLLARHVAFGRAQLPPDVLEPEWSPIRGPSMKTKWARERDVPQAMAMNVFTRPLSGPTRIGRGQNHWVQPDVDDMSDEELEDVITFSAPPIDDDDTMQIDVDMDDAPPPTHANNAGFHQMGEDQLPPGMTMEREVDLLDAQVIVPTALCPNGRDDEEMTDIYDLISLSGDLTPPSSPNVSDTPWVPTSRETLPLARTPITAPPRFTPTYADLFCPPKLIDVADAWDFIEHMAQNPTVPFQTKGSKTDTRKGAQFKGKKHPVAGLLMKALKERRSGPSMPLVNQDPMPFCQMASIAPPKTVAVGVYLGAQVELTLTECMAYFTNHYCQRPLLVRFVRAGLNGGSIANEINMARQLSGEAAFTHSRPWTRLRRASPPVPVPDPTGTKTKDFTARQWKTSKSGIDYPLLALEHGLDDLPKGDDAGPLTHLIKWCKAQGHYRAMLSDVPALLEHTGIAAEIAKPANGGCPDRAAIKRHQKRVVQDRARVLTTRGPG